MDDATNGRPRKEWASLSYHEGYQFALSVRQPYTLHFTKLVYPGSMEVETYDDFHPVGSIAEAFDCLNQYMESANANGYTIIKYWVVDNEKVMNGQEKKIEVWETKDGHRWTKENSILGK